MFEVTYIDNNKKRFETYQEFLKDENFNDIIKLNCINNQITSLDNLTAFGEGVRNPTELDFLPAKLKYLYCNNNQITSLDNLPAKLEYLHCYDNQITSLDNLTAFGEGVRNPTELDFLPTKLEYLFCTSNQITSLDNLPANLEILYCHNNQITSLDNLPEKLKTLNCDDNQITSLDNLLLSNLKYFYYRNNPIYEIVNKYFDRDLKKYNLWKRNYLKKFVLKIENWFLECKYNPDYKYCQKFVMEGYNFYETSISSERSFNETKILLK